MYSPLLSIVIANYNHGKYLEEAILSIVEQKGFEECELIVVDGNSQDNSIDVIEQNSKKISWWISEKDGGQSDALNKGIAHARGEWLTWLNADDVLLSGALLKILSRIKNSGRSCWFSGDTVYIDERGIVLDVRQDAKWRCWFRDKTCVWTGGPSSVFRRNLWEKYGELDTHLKYVMDIDLWTRWARVGVQFVGIEDYLWGFRIHQGSATMGGGNEIEHHAEKKALLVRYGIRHPCFWQNISRWVSILDGSWLRRRRDTKLFHGTHWRDIGR